MDFERIAREVVSGLLDPLLERRDYGGNQLDKGVGRRRKHVLRKKPRTANTFPEGPRLSVLLQKDGRILEAKRLLGPAN